MGGAFGRIARLLRRPAGEPGDPVPDAELLGRFVRAADQSAFELLVWRHAVMVLGVCRRIVRDEHLAEDAFQATFLVLARKAGSVRGSNLAGWLFRVARRVAVRARTQAAARARRETPLATEPPAPQAADHGDVLAILDEEIARLPERFRLPVVLCYLGGRSTEDAARLLGCPRGTILSRLATARTRLAARLTRRGVTVSASLFTVASLSSGLGAVAPLVAPAVRLAAGNGATGSAAEVLAHGVITAMSIKKTITAAGTFVVAIGLVWGLGLVAADGPSPEAAQKAKAPAGQPPEKAKPPAPTPQHADDLDSAMQERVKRLEKLAEQLRTELATRERAIRSWAENIGGGSATEAALARLERTITKLDDEVFAAEKEIVELDVQIELLKRKPPAALPEAGPEEVARAVEADARVVDLLKQLKEKQFALDRGLAASGKDSPAIVALRDEVTRLNNSVAETRAAVRGEVEAALKAAARKLLEGKITDLEDRLAVAKGVLEVRKHHRDDMERKYLRQSRNATDLGALMKELAPVQESLRKVENQLVELRIERELKSPLEAKPVGVEAKLDRLIREVEELRREVRELRKP